MLHPALMAERGFVVHRDVFSQDGPLISIVYAGFVRLSGPTLWSIHFGACVLLAGANAILYVINRRLFGVSLATVVPFLPLRVSRAEVNPNPVLEHMLIDEDHLRFFETRSPQVAVFRERCPNVMLLNICSDGLLSSLTSFKPHLDTYFVSWKFGLDPFNPRSVVGKTRLEFIRCEHPIVWTRPLTENPELLSELHGLTLPDIDSSLPTEDQHGWWPYVSFLGVPTEWENHTREYKQ